MSPIAAYTGKVSESVLIFFIIKIITKPLVSIGTMMIDGREIYMQIFFFKAAFYYAFICLSKTPQIESLCNISSHVSFFPSGHIIIIRCR